MENCTKKLVNVIPAQAGIHDLTKTMRMKNGYVYILTNKPNGILYIGVTNNLVRRIYEHKEKMVDGFTKQYGLNRLIYYEIHDSMEAAIHREKCMKEWTRAWKVRRILEKNPGWDDLYNEIAVMA